MPCSLLLWDIFYYFGHVLHVYIYISIFYMFHVLFIALDSFFFCPICFYIMLMLSIARLLTFYLYLYHTYSFKFSLHSKFGWITCLLLQILTLLSVFANVCISLILTLIIINSEMWNFKIFVSATNWIVIIIRSYPWKLFILWINSFY